MLDLRYKYRWVSDWGMDLGIAEQSETLLFQEKGNQKYLLEGLTATHQIVFFINAYI